MNTELTVRDLDGEVWTPLAQVRDLLGLTKDHPLLKGLDEGDVREIRGQPYISTAGWASLWAHALRFWLLHKDRSQENEFYTVEELGLENDPTYDDEIVEAIYGRKPWPWYGIERAAAMLGIMPSVLRTALVGEGYIRLPARGERLTVKRDAILTEKGEAAEWLRYKMPEPSPYGKWKATVVIDMAHPFFTELVAHEFGYTVEEVSPRVKAAIEKAHEKRKQAWQKQRAAEAEALIENEAKAKAKAEAKARVEAAQVALEEARRAFEAAQAEDYELLEEMIA